eukprot:TRINITY_DN30622_c0_g1_i1.p1 TRINITY_DN30622_c0_g1~~TRINITY_DN30622_c0_g1_i1.p1  ORF type:complete len:349 (-),score=31.10 TRINITY_DN30622_c0_g1_i1:165-1211(-)
MRELWRDIHPHVGTESYAMDIVYLPQSDELRMLELSPFLRCTGAHCFRWTVPEDLDVLEGRKSFQFRLVQKSSPQFEEMFCSGWEERWYRESPPAFWEWYQTPAERCLSRLRQRWQGLQVGFRKPPLLAACLTFALTLGCRGQRCQFLKAWALIAGIGCSLRGLQTLGQLQAKRDWQFLFVYGTLKRGMHWNQKFLTLGADFQGMAITSEAFPLVVGHCGVPYLLQDQRGSGHQVRGEVWRVDADTLDSLDQYEGITKGHYVRQSIKVELGGRCVAAQVYAMKESPASCRLLPLLKEYSMQLHTERYNAVAHILLKQQLYLQGQKLYSCRTLVHPPRCIDDDFAGWQT